MPLSPGTRLGHFEIVSPLGAGGMGEVYRAKDTRLGRDVAIKVLPQHLSASPELRLRMKREARSISQLNHPNICVLYDVGQDGDIDYLVMELIQGETLADRLARGALPPAEVLKIGAEVANALDRAHRAGIVHRDLKPGNIMLTQAGSKLMDFGLARAAQGAVTQTAMTESPTVPQPLTGEGMIVGTFQYMAPEQLEGREADARSDIWALGCVLYEMATGVRPFHGTSPASLVGSIMHSEPRPLSELAPLSPPALDHVVRRCLAKNPEDRWQSARDVAHELRYIGEASSSIGAKPSGAKRASRERVFWISMLAILAGFLIVSTLTRNKNETNSSGGVTRFTIAPENVSLFPDASDPAISPDGRTLAFTGIDSSGVLRLWLRARDTLLPRPLSGTEGASLPFWSPDSKSLGFFVTGKMLKVRVDGGPPQEICAANNGRGGTWSKDGIIVFAPTGAGAIYRVPASGGTPTQVTEVDTTKHETGHRWPWFLPDGKHFLFVVLPGQNQNYEAYVGSIDGGPREPLFSVIAAPVFAEPGYLVFVRNATLMAQPFNPRTRKVTGGAIALEAMNVYTNLTGTREVTASKEGTLAFQTSRSLNSELVWYDREGHTLGKATVDPGRYEDVALSPDGSRIAVARRSSPTTMDLWLYDLQSNQFRRFTFGSDESFRPVWSPDGKEIAFAWNRGGPENLYVRAVDGHGSERLVYESNALFKNLVGWSPDGRYLTFSELNGPTGLDVVTLFMNGSSKAVPYAQTSFNEVIGNISPDGHWMAYISDETGLPQVYVDSFPTPGNKAQISTAGAGAISQDLGWTRDGKKLIFLGLDSSIMEVDIQTTPEFRAGTPRMLFRFRPDVGSISMTRDGRRFLASEPAGGGTSITMITNWTELLKH